MRFKVFSWGAFLFVFSLFATNGFALRVGEKAPNFRLPDPYGKIYTLNSFKGKVLSIFYVDPDASDQNDHVSDAFKKANFPKDKYKGIGIVNAKPTWKPNFIIRAILKRKMAKYKGAVFLMDTDLTLARLWNLGDTDDKSIVVILDKKGICRWIYKGRVPASKVKEAVNIIWEYIKK